MPVYRVEVIADSSGKWCGNQLTFTSIAEASEYAAGLAWRWTAVRKWRVIDYLMRVAVQSDGFVN